MSRMRFKPYAPKPGVYETPGSDMSGARVTRIAFNAPTQVTRHYTIAKEKPQKPEAEARIVPDLGDRSKDRRLLLFKVSGTWGWHARATSVYYAAKVLVVEVLEEKEEGEIVGEVLAEVPLRHFGITAAGEWITPPGAEPKFPSKDAAE